MSFGKKMRAQRRTTGLFSLAILAALGMGATVLPPAPIEAVGQTTSQAPREFANTAPIERKAKPTVANRVKGGSRRGIDTRKGRRRLLMTLAGRPNSGRQWARVRRDTRRLGNADLLRIPEPQLRAIANAFGLTPVRRHVTD